MLVYTVTRPLQPLLATATNDHRSHWVDFLSLSFFASKPWYLLLCYSIYLPPQDPSTLSLSFYMNYITCICNRRTLSTTYHGSNSVYECNLKKASWIDGLLVIVKDRIDICYEYFILFQSSRMLSNFKEIYISISISVSIYRFPIYLSNLYMYQLHLSISISLSLSFYLSPYLSILSLSLYVYIPIVTIINQSINLSIHD